MSLLPRRYNHDKPSTSTPMNAPSKLQRFARIAICCVIGAGLVGQARADVIYAVNSTMDQIDDNPGDGVCHTAANTCSLRAAVMEANRADALEAKILVPPGTYNLTSGLTGTSDEEVGDLDFTTPTGGGATITLQGSGATTTIIDANQIDRVIEVFGMRTVVIASVTLRNGRTYLNGGGLSALFNSAVTINDCVIAANRSLDGNGGGIAAKGDLAIMHSELRGNTSSDNGGGVWSVSPLNIATSSITQNVAHYGGGLFVAGVALIAETAIVNNAASQNGGGLFLHGDLQMVNSTLAGNTAADFGGGIYASVNTANSSRNIYNTTIAFNGADEDQNFLGSGGGLYVETLAPAVSFNIYNTIIAANAVSATPQPDDCKGVVQTHGQNLFGNTNGCTVVQISGSWNYLNGLDLLGPPQYNGGPTKTVALLEGSNAINAGNPTLGCLDKNSMTIATDQRGFPRNVGICDLGAYEYGSLDPNNLIFENGFE